MKARFKMTLTDDTKCVVNLNHVDIFGIDGVQYSDKPETIEQKLNRAIETKKADLKMYQEYIKTHDTKDNHYWADRYEAEKDFHYVIMTLAEFRKLEREKYLSKPLRESNKSEYWEMLEVLPPEKWVTIDNVNMFCMSEHYTGLYTMQYAHDRNTDKYYSKMVDVTDQSTWIHSILKNGGVING